MLQRVGVKLNRWTKRMRAEEAEGSTNFLISPLPPPLETYWVLCAVTKVSDIAT